MTNTTSAESGTTNSAAGFWALAYKVPETGKVLYCISGGGARPHGNGRGRADVTDDPAKAKRFTSREEALAAVPHFSGWILANLETHRIDLPPTAERDLLGKFLLAQAESVDFLHQLHSMAIGAVEECHSFEQVKQVLASLAVASKIYLARRESEEVPA